MASQSSTKQLATIVKAKYDEAKAAGAMTFAESYMTEPVVAGLLYQLRYCPSLAKKPGPTPSSTANKDAAQAQQQAPPRKKTDPFENPSLDLLISDTTPQTPSHILVLNKFPIIPHHFILATQTNKPQTHLLEPDDLLATYQCLRSWSNSINDNDTLFAFFNSGHFSGASQPHRHIQFLPESSMAQASTAPHKDNSATVADKNSKWHLLTHAIETAPIINQSHNLRALPPLPFVHFGLQVPEGADATTLFTMYTVLYAAARGSVEKYIAANPDELSLHPTEGGELPISYNLGMTTSCMTICPRRAEGRMVQRGDGSDIDNVALNGTMLGGTLMAKDEEVWEVLREDAGKVEEVLVAAGLPRGMGYDVFGDGEVDVGRWSELRGALRPVVGSL